MGLHKFWYLGTRLGIWVESVERKRFLVLMSSPDKI